MEHRTLAEIKPDARIIPLEDGSANMSKRQRLDRLATLLERYPQPVRLLSRVEYMASAERMQLRADGSLLSIACRDPVLRREGLASDRMGDAMAFFDLSEHEAHELFCDCHYHGAVSSTFVAARIRSTARQASMREMWSGLRRRAAALAHALGGARRTA